MSFDHSVGKISLKDLCDAKVTFCIPRYQRGYRWNTKHVSALLNDLKSYVLKKKDHPEVGDYCLQPIVIQPIKDRPDAYIVVDGQQRLTTLGLICKKARSETWSVEPIDDNVLSKDWLSDKCRENACRNIDEESAKTIFEGNGNIVFIYYKLKLRESEADDVLARRVFRRLNAGKIALTNAELIRAIFMEPHTMCDSEQMEIAAEWEQIACRIKDDAFWHMFEMKQVPVYERMDRLFDIITAPVRTANPECFSGLSSFEIIEDTLRRQCKVCDGTNQLTDANSRDEVLTCWWRKLLDLYWMLERCYKSIPLYHYIGWVLRATDTRFETVYLWYNSDSVDFEKKIRNEIVRILGKYLKRENVCYSFEPDKANSRSVFTFPCFFGRKGEVPSFGSNSKDSLFCERPEVIRKLLLFYNVERLNQTYVVSRDGDAEVSSNNRFPFDLYDDVARRIGWDVEHVSSYTENPMEVKADRFRWALSFLLEEKDENDCLWQDVAEWVGRQKDKPEFLDESEKVLMGELETKTLDDCDDCELGTEFNKLYERWVDRHRNELLRSDDAIRLGNLVLLDAKTNRGYRNAMFLTKRAWIKDVEIGRSNLRDQRYIPQATSDVFKKAYNKKPHTFSFWTKEDLESYEEEMALVFDRFCKVS